MGRDLHVSHANQTHLRHVSGAPRGFSHRTPLASARMHGRNIDSAITSALPAGGTRTGTRRRAGCAVRTCLSAAPMRSIAEPARRLKARASFRRPSSPSAAAHVGHAQRRTVRNVAPKIPNGPGLCVASIRQSMRDTSPPLAKPGRRPTRGQITEYARKRNAMKRGLPGSHSFAEWRALCEKFDYRCVCCGEKRPLTRDHVIPVTKPGSSDSIDNIQPMCSPCNSSKKRQTIDYRQRPSPQERRRGSK
jgi:5-methylcytosine-specific restriction endonuclease McrA